MPYVEKRGERYRVRWRLPDGSYSSASRDEYGEPFTTEEAARAYGLNMEADIRRGLYKDPRAGQIPFSEWAETWYAAQDLERSTMNNYRRLLKAHIMGPFGHVLLPKITPEMVASWERSIVAAGYAQRTARDARGVLITVLNAAVRAGHITTNPAARIRGTGRKGLRRIEEFEKAEKVWPSPLDALLIAERVALLSGRESDFVMVVLAAYTGLRWSEVLALTPEAFSDEGIVKVHWKLYEDAGRWYWGRPKDGSVRELDLPLWLWQMARQVKARRCSCPKDAEGDWCSGRREVLFLGERQHHRRSDWPRLYLRPAAEGWYPARGGKFSRSPMPVLANAATEWPGEPLLPWPAAEPGKPYEPGRLARMHRDAGPGPVNSRSTRAALAAYAIDQGADEEIVKGMSREALLDAYVRPSVNGLVSWLPILPGLTFHGFRHGHQTWMDDGAIKSKLKVERMGHTDFSISARYGHVTPAMRAELIELLDGLWETSLQARAELSPRSSVRVLDAALGAFRGGVVTALFSQNSPKTARGRLTG